MRKLMVFPNKAALKEGRDALWAQIGATNVVRYNPDMVTDNLGNAYFFAVITGPDSHWKVQGLRFDEIEAYRGLPEQTLRFLQTLERVEVDG